MKNEPIVVEEVFYKEAKTVWKAITELNQMIQWFFENIPAFKPVVGFKTAFNVKSTERDFFHQWEITEVIPEKKITYSWRYKNLSGESFSTFELFEEGNKTRLRVTCVGLESLPQDIPEFKRESCLGGWNYFINQRLKKYLNS